MTILMFPGQGSQAKGMGKTLFEKFPDVTDSASDILGYDVRELCLEDPEKKLGLTQYTQPALFLVNALAWYEIRDSGDCDPGFALGHSLGEYNALLAAEVFDFQTGLKLVQERGRLMGEAKGGTMAAVMMVSSDKIQQVLADHHIDDIDLANFNTPKQTVIAGPKESIAKAVKVLKAEKARVITLRVSAPFHSRYMTDASRAFAEFLKAFELKSPKFPVIANATARPYGPEETAELLARQIASPVKWEESIRYLMATAGDLEFKEVTAKILTKMVTEIRKNCDPLPAEEITPTEPESTEQTKEEAAPEPETDRMVGDPGFCRRYGLSHPYIAGAMYRGISSKEMVAVMARAGMIAYLGTGELPLERIEADIRWLDKELGDKYSWGANLMHTAGLPQLEEDTVDLFLKYGVRFVEASGYLQMSQALVRYRLSGLKRERRGRVTCSHHVLGKCSRPEIAEQLLSPAPDRIVQKLLEEGKITRQQAEMAGEVPVASEVCVEGDSGGHTDMGVPAVLLPAMQMLRDRLSTRYEYKSPVYIGLGGGIGTPEAAMAAFVMGADFILTGSINQCTVESGSSETVKTMLQDINVQDTDYTPSGDMFEMGAKVQVLRRGVFFPARAKKLHELYTHYDSLSDIPEKTARQIQDRYFKKSFEAVWDAQKARLESEGRHDVVAGAQASPKQKMAMVFRWYFRRTADLALAGDPDHTVDYQVHTGPSLGAFNQWVQGSDLASWQNRHVDRIAMKLLDETEVMLKQKMKAFLG